MEKVARQIVAVLACGTFVVWITSAPAQIFDQDTRNETDEEGAFALMKFGAPGELVIDSTGDRFMFPALTKDISFRSQYQLLEWAMKYLNARPVYDERKVLIGVRGVITQYGSLMKADESTKTVREIVDPIAEILGGRTGYLTVEGKTDCINQEKCGQEKKSHLFTRPEIQLASLEWPLIRASHAPSSRTSCNSGSTFCIDGESWRRNWWFYRSIGAKTKQIRGGFRVEHFFCWKWGFIPWSCSRRVGSNDLRVDATYFAQGISGLVSFVQSRSCRDCQSVSHKFWSFFVTVTIPGPSIGTACTAECEIKGVCGSHFGSGPEGFATTSTGAATHICD